MRKWKCFFLAWTAFNFRGRGKTKNTARDIYKRTLDIEFEWDRSIGLGSTIVDGQTDRQTDRHTHTFFSKTHFRNPYLFALQIFYHVKLTHCNLQTCTIFEKRFYNFRDTLVLLYKFTCTFLRLHVLSWNAILSFSNNLYYCSHVNCNLYFREIGPWWWWFKDGSSGTQCLILTGRSHYARYQYGQPQPALDTQIE